MIPYHVSAQTVNFTVLPSSQVVVEGGNATFHCSTNNGTQAYTVLWSIRGRNDLIINIGSSRPVDGTGGVVVGDDNGSPLVLTSVSRSLNETTVTCSARISIAIRITPSEPPANLTVICKFIVFTDYYMDKMTLEHGSPSL